MLDAGLPYTVLDCTVFSEIPVRSIREGRSFEMGEFRGIESIRGFSPLRMLLTSDLRTKPMAGRASSVQLLRS